MVSPPRCPTPRRPRRAQCTSVRPRWPRPTRKASRSACKATGLKHECGGGVIPAAFFFGVTERFLRGSKGAPLIVSQLENKKECTKMNRKGFTLIELLIVVVIIGILAAIAIPKFANTKEKAYLASMKSDLRNLITAEEANFADSVKYTSNLGPAYATTTGVVSPTIAVTADGFTATVTHTTTTKTCSIYVGSTSLAPANKEGEPKCA